MVAELRARVADLEAVQKQQQLERFRPPCSGCLLGGRGSCRAVGASPSHRYEDPETALIQITQYPTEP
jgi:hypothetical protein